MAGLHLLRTVQLFAVVSVLLIWAYFITAFAYLPHEDERWLILMVGLLLALPHLGIVYSLHTHPKKKDVLSTIVWASLLGSGLFLLVSRGAAVPVDQPSLPTMFLVPFGAIQLGLIASAFTLYVTKKGVAECGQDVFDYFRSSVANLCFTMVFLFGLLALLSILAIGYEVLRGLYRFLEAPIGIKPGGGGDSTIVWVGLAGLVVFGFLTSLFVSLWEQLDSPTKPKGTDS